MKLVFCLVAVLVSIGFVKNEQHYESHQKGDSSADCGIGPPESNITGAIDFNPNVAWHVTIFRKSADGGVPVPYCGGTILNQKLVLSAMTCFWHKNEEISLTEYIVAVGDHHLNYTDIERPTAQFLGIQEILYKDDKHDLSSKDHTAVILVLNDSIKFKSNIYPICIPSNGSHTLEIQNEIQNEIQGRLSTEDSLYIFIFNKTIKSVECSNRNMVLYNGNSNICTDHVIALRIQPKHTGSSFIQLSKSKSNQYFLNGILTNIFDAKISFADIQFYLDFIAKTISKYI